MQPQSEIGKIKVIHHWSEIEEKKLSEALIKYDKKDYKKISEYVGSRNPTQVRTHLQKMKGKLNKKLLEVQPPLPPDCS